MRGEGIEMSGGVFICYRQEDSAGFAGRIYDRLKAILGRDGVFIDVDNIPAGRDFVEVLSERVGRCDALIAVIGRKWLVSADNDNRRRIDNPTDFVRIEIEAALARNVPVIPVLVDGAVMPRADDLPDALKKLARRQGIEISHNRFDSDAERLIDALARKEHEFSSATATPRSLRLPSKQVIPTARWLLALALGLVVVTGVCFFYVERGPYEGAALQHGKMAQEQEKSTSNTVEPPPVPLATNVTNVVVPSSNVAVFAPTSPLISSAPAQSITAAEEVQKGDNYFYGRGDEQDYNKAAEWYRRAAEQGDAGAEYMVGVIYEQIMKDLPHATQWYQKAADIGYERAKLVLRLVQTKVDTVSSPIPIGWSVQLASRDSAAQAVAELASLNDKYASQLNPLSITIGKFLVSGDIKYRLRVVNLAKADADTLCSRLKIAGAECYVTK